MIPQAYTMRDVSDAYRWAQTLPSTVREEFKSVEAMVAAFIKTKRLNNPIVPSSQDHRLATTASAPEQSRSAQDFQKALKDLQPELNQFDFAPPSAPTQTATATQTSSQTAQSLTITKVTTQQATQRSLSEEFDPRSRAAIQEIRESLNLSSDIEAIRVCITMGHKHLKSLLGL